MEKYGVEQEYEKVAEVRTDKGVCPTCGAELEEKGKVQWCPNCGTKPFEGDLSGKED